jgi:hypothetical protein
MDQYSPADITAQGNENYFYWHHMANAGIIEGSYTHAALPLPNDTFDGLLARMRYPANTYWNPHTTLKDEIPTDNTNFTIEGNAMETLNNNWVPAFIAEDAWNIDKKMDDGVPNTGRILATKGDDTYPCTTVANQPTNVNAAYNLNSKDPYCNLYFMKAF